jgi:two-component system LytT family response regulator
MKCVIIDDEPLAVDVVKEFLSKIEIVELVATFNNAIDAISFINDSKIDLIFLDIEMPQFSGIEFLKSLERKPMVIFTTAYSDYAVEGFDIGAIDYLVKPIPFHRFFKAVLRAKQMLEPLINIPSPILPTLKTPIDFIFVKAEYENIKLNLSDIIYIEGLKDYVKIHTSNGKFILTLNSLKKFEESLLENNFFRIHRSYIVNLKHIKSIQKNKVIIMEKRIPIGENYKAEFYNQIQF